MSSFLWIHISKSPIAYYSKENKHKPQLETIYIIITPSSPFFHNEVIASLTSWYTYALLSLDLLVIQFRNRIFFGFNILFKPFSLPWLVLHVLGTFRCLVTNWPYQNCRFSRSHCVVCTRMIVKW